MASKVNIKLPAQTVVAMEPLGKGANKRTIRRPILVDRASGLVYELPTVYIYRQLKNKSLNSQKAVLNDLSFFLAWIELRIKRNPDFRRPEDRVRRNAPPLSHREIIDFCNWCQRSSADLAASINQNSRKIISLPVGKPVDSSTTNRRILSVKNYLEWLIREYVEDSESDANARMSLGAALQKKIREDLYSNLNIQAKAATIRSLNQENTDLVRSKLSTTEIFPNDSHGNRDRLIAALLMESGLRAGEVLKLWTTDIYDNYAISVDRIIGLIEVIRRPNDSQDERKDEPAVKTLPGQNPISLALASAIKKYIFGDRRLAINRRSDGKEHPYLFVCHSGTNIGKPISRRNLNRIISKLKSVSKDLTQISPHVLRHTHFTEYANSAEDKGLSETTIRSLLIERGHWSPSSTMPERYTQRRIARIGADLIAERDTLIEPKAKS